VFDDPEHEPMVDAQQRKYARLLDALEARPGQHILEVGCGWGGFVELAARRGHRVTGITLSRAQLDYARERIRRAGLSDRVELRLQDYRDVNEQFDHVVSIEMIEAVGEAYWPTFFRALARLTLPGGRIAVQGITIEEAAFERYRRAADFIQLYIFPGGMLMTPERFGAEAEGAGLRVLARDFFGRHYAETLKRWHKSFSQCGEKLRELGYDRRFQRLWMYYLAYCEVGFLRGRVDLMHAVLERPDPCPQTA
jgi:cyclopropane-fatty-acyl-phospholipid synthase